MKTIEDEIRELTIESKKLSKELERIWNKCYGLGSGTSYLICDSCEDKENKNGI
jgi:hypothetical protein